MTNPNPDHQHNDHDSDADAVDGALPASADSEQIRAWLAGAPERRLQEAQPTTREELLARLDPDTAADLRAHQQVARTLVTVATDEDADEVGA